MIAWLAECILLHHTRGATQMPPADVNKISSVAKYVTCEESYQTLENISNISNWNDNIYHCASLWYGNYLWCIMQF